MDIPLQVMSDRKQFREKVKKFSKFKEREKKKTGAPWTDERKKEHSERMKKYWKDKKKT
jgi:hypothetical protein